MKITENVISDLLPAYMSGEATEDTILLVEEYFKNNPDFEKIYKQELNTDIKVNRLDLNEVKLLERTKRMIKFRSLVFGFAIFFSALPFSFYGNETEVHWLWENLPSVAYISGSLGICLWITYINLQKRLSVTGL